MNWSNYRHTDENNELRKMVDSMMAGFNYLAPVETLKDLEKLIDNQHPVEGDITYVASDNVMLIYRGNSFITFAGPDMYINDISEGILLTDKNADTILELKSLEPK